MCLLHVRTIKAPLKAPSAIFAAEVYACLDFLKQLAFRDSACLPFAVRSLLVIILGKLATNPCGWNESMGTTSEQIFEMSEKMKALPPIELTEDEREILRTWLISFIFVSQGSNFFHLDAPSPPVGRTADGVPKWPSDIVCFEDLQSYITRQDLRVEIKEYLDSIVRPIAGECWYQLKNRASIGGRYVNGFEYKYPIHIRVGQMVLVLC